MPDWLDKLLKRKPSAEFANGLREDIDLEAFFTDVEHLRQVFYDLVSAETLSKRLLVIHGVGGIGKSTLLRMFRLFCKRQRVPVALVSGDEAKSPVDVLGGFAHDLAQDGVELPDLTRTLERYREIQAKVEREGAKVGATMAKAGAKTAVEIAAGYIPGVGPVVAALGGAGAEAFIDWLHGFLPKSDLDLYLDPTVRLTRDLLHGLGSQANDRRLVLMLDTYEQMTGLDEWVRDLVKHLPGNVLSVIAGRQAPGRTWDRDWPGWMSHARIEAIESMDESCMGELVRRYYATMRGDEPDASQVRDIVQFARGVPLVITSAVRLWVQYGLQDFRAVRPQVVADLVDRLMEGTPAKMRPALEAAAAVRWFHKDILRELLPAQEVEDVYDELRRFPFVRSRAEGLALHDVVREILDENLQVHEPDRHCQVHEKMAAYFERESARVTKEDRSRLALERLYHCMRANEDKGLCMFQDMADELAGFRLTSPLRALLQDVNTYPLQKKNSKLWLRYYSAKLAHLIARLAEAEEGYLAVGQDEQAEPKLRAYALCDYGGIWARGDRLSRPGGIQRAETALERSQTLAPSMDANLVMVYLYLRNIAMFKAEWQEALVLLEKQRMFYEQNHDTYGLVYTLGSLREVHGVIGDWKRASDATNEGIKVLKTTLETPILRWRLAGYCLWDQIWSGHYAQAEQGIQHAIAYSRDIERLEIRACALYRELGLILGLQRRHTEAMTCFEQSIAIGRSLGDDWKPEVASALGFWGAILSKMGKMTAAKEALTESLAMKQRLQDSIGIPEVANWLGELHEADARRPGATDDVNRLAVASSFYEQTLDLHWTGRQYFESGALTGLVRVKCAQGDFTPLLTLLSKAWRLAQQYEYNDHMASLLLTQGHIASRGHIDDWDTGFDAALTHYQQALIYALRFNRFLLDEVLWGDGICTPLDPIIPHCQVQGDEGRRMLAALRDWWQTGINDVGAQRLDTISPIPEDISLLKAECIAREREPGDGARQRTVTEILDAALVEMN